MNRGGILLAWAALAVFTAGGWVLLFWAGLRLLKLMLGAV